MRTLRARREAALLPDRSAWYTPLKYIESARAVLGSIELDPFSCEAANQVVQADRYYDRASDAFTRNWSAHTIWMSPPYARGVVDAAVDRLLDELAKRNVESAIVLVNNSFSSGWFQRALRVADAMCLPRGRIQFWTNDDKTVSHNKYAQAFLLFGPDLVPAFHEQFREHGTVLTPVES